MGFIKYSCDGRRTAKLYDDQGRFITTAVQHPQKNFWEFSLPQNLEGKRIRILQALEEYLLKF